MRNNIGYLRLIRMTQALNLTEDQTTRIYPMFNRVEKEKVALQRDLALDLQELRRLLRDVPAAEAAPGPDQAGRLTELVRKIGDTRREIRAKDDALDEFLERELNPLQKARYVLFQIEFNQGLGDVLDRVRGRRLNQGVPIKK
jgi:Mg2+ and Co2+ transporter CorA